MERMTDKLSLPEQLKLAEDIATKAHVGQFRKSHVKGEHIPYIVHPKRVAEHLRHKYPNEPSYQIVAWLHDVLEDTHYDREDLIENGIGEEYVVMVESLTRKKDETYFDFIMRMDLSHMPRRVKIADIEDNMNDNLEEGSLKDKYRLALYILNGFEKKWEKRKNKKLESV